MTYITAKAKLNSVELSASSVQLKFIADYTDPRNKDWAAFTPTLNFSMCVRPDVYEKNFELGTNYTVTFSPDAPAEGAA